MILNLYGITKTLKDNVCVAPIKKGGILLTVPPVKAKLLNNQFQSVFVKEDVSSDIPKLDSDPFYSISNLTITVAGVEKLLSHLAIYKTPGPAQIIYSFKLRTRFSNVCLL